MVAGLAPVPDQIKSLLLPARRHGNSTRDLHDILQARGIDRDFLGVSRTGGAAAAGARICTVTCLEREVARVTQRKQPDKGA
jgi:hypothetical protein